MNLQTILVDSDDDDFDNDIVYNSPCPEPDVNIICLSSSGDEDDEDDEDDVVKINDSVHETNDISVCEVRNFDKWLNFFNLRILFSFNELK